MDEAGAVLLELERLRGAVETGFAHINGRLDGTVQRTSTTEDDVKGLERRVALLERKVWMASGISGVLAIGCSGAIVALVQSMGH